MKNRFDGYLGISDSVRIEPRICLSALRDLHFYARFVGDPEVIQTGTRRISTDKSATVYRLLSKTGVAVEKGTKAVISTMQLLLEDRFRQIWVPSWENRRCFANNHLNSDLAWVLTEKAARECSFL